MPIQGHRQWLLKTGQPFWYETEYVICPDDGYYNMGISRMYTVLSTGQYSGTTNITVNAKTDVHSNNCVLDERTGLMWTRYNTASVGPNSDGRLYWDNHVASLPFTKGGGYVDFQVGENVQQAVTTAQGTIRYVDNTNGIMWLENVGGTFNYVNQITGSLGGGPATPTSYTAPAKEDIWEYLRVANSNGLAGYTDWRVPNVMELASLVTIGNSNGAPNTAIFPSLNTTGYFWTGTVVGSPGLNAVTILFLTAALTTKEKAGTTGYLLLVRGPDLSSWRPCRPLVSGQYRQSVAFPDDGMLQLGRPRALELLTTDAQSGTTNITLNGKTCTMSNNLVLDRNTGLMWTRDVSSSVGPNSDGNLYWLDTSLEREDIWEFLRLANEAGLAGYRDWRIPNAFEILSVCNFANASSNLDGNYFNSAGANFWSSTTKPNDRTCAFRMSTGYGSGVVKSTSLNPVRLVRGGHTDADL